MFNLADVQLALRQLGLDGWLMVDFRGNNVLAKRVLGLRESLKTTRRWAYFVSAFGAPRMLCHAIEPEALADLPGDRTIYLSWQSYEAGLQTLVGDARRIAMEYAPRNNVPVVARVDAGTVELVRSFGADVVSSGDLVQLFEATWDDQQWQMHLEAARYTNGAYGHAWQFIADRLRSGAGVTELEVQQLIIDYFAANGLTTYSPPIVGVNEHGGDPHFENSPANNRPIREGDLLLLDLWAKMDKPRAVYSDLTRMAYIGEETPERFERVFQVVAAARDAAIAFIRTTLAAGQSLEGWQVDDACRAVIEAAGYGKQFIHRTGHNIGQETHGNGANIDNLETHEVRRLLPSTCFSIEPGIYLPEFGVRSETNVYLDANFGVHVTGGKLQERILPLLAMY